MKLVLTKEEVSKILIDHANKIMPANFDECQLSERYSYSEAYCTIGKKGDRNEDD